MTAAPPIGLGLEGRAGERAPADTALLESWFDLLHKMLPNPGAAIVVENRAGACGELLLARTKRSQAPAYLLDVAARVVASNAPVKRSGVFGQPLRRDGQTFAALAIALKVDKAQQTIVLHLLDWAARWLDLLLTSSGTPRSTVPGVNAGGAPIDLLRRLLAAGPLEAALLTLADQLAERFACSRVAVGVRRGRRVPLLALSHGVQFDRRTRLAAELGDALTHTLAEGNSVWPSTSVGASHPVCAVARSSGADTVLCAPLGDNAAVVLERRGERFFSPDDVRDLTDIAGFVGPVIDLKRDQRAWLPPRLRAATLAACDRLFKPGHRGVKAAAAGAALLILFLTFAQAGYRVRADAHIEGLIQRAVVAPFDGFIAAATFRAGDTVAAGDVIARMEDRELRLELRKSAGEEETLDNEYRRALASADRSEAQVAQARLAQTRAQTRLLSDKLERVQLSAPMDGIIISGDLSDSLGAPVERGDVLFEVAPLNAYRLILEIDEADVADVRAGQTGRLTLAALPGQPLDFVIQRVSPVFLERDGEVVYRTEARIAGDASMLRPGMEGVGKVEIGSRSVGWLLFHDLRDWLRLKLWLWLP